MKQNKLLLISFIVNVLIFLLMIVGVILTFTVGSGPLSPKDIRAFRYFTFQSNLLMGVVCFIYALFQLLIMLGKRSKLPHILIIINHIVVTAVGVTLVIVLAFLAPINGFSYFYIGANVLFHAVIPLLAIINYIFFEREMEITFLSTLFSIIPCLLYGIIYFIYIASLNGYGNLDIDFYGFGKDGPLLGALYFLIIVAIAYLISLFLYFMHRLVFKKRP